jgi:electron transport complex protein RnfA
MNGTFILLLIYSGFTINLILQCALGIKGVVESKGAVNISTLVKAGLIFFSIIFIWFFFSRILNSFFSGILIYILLFPFSVIVYDTLEYLIFNYLIKKDAQNDSIISFPGGITAVSVFICINLARGFLETVILSFGFISGIFLVNLIIREIRRRAALEAVPLFLRGKPLVLIAMGLLSLVFTTVSLLLFRMINAG